MLLLTIYMFRRILNISYNRNRKYLLVLSQSRFPIFSQYICTKEENEVTAASRQNSFFLPTPQ